MRKQRNSKSFSGSLLHYIQALPVSSYAKKLFAAEYEKKDNYESVDIVVDGQLIGWRVTPICDSNSMYPEDYDAMAEILKNPEMRRHSEGRIVGVSGVCSCQKFSSYGIACRHVIHVSSVTQYKIESTPAVIGGAFAEVWKTNDVSSVTVNQPEGTITRVTTPKTQRQKLLNQKFELIRSAAEVSESVSDDALETLTQFCISRNLSVPTASAIVSSVPAQPVVLQVLNPAKPTTRCGIKRKLCELDYVQKAVRQALKKMTPKTRQALKKTTPKKKKTKNN